MPVVAYVSRRCIASKIAARVFSVAQTAAYPEAPTSQSMILTPVLWLSKKAFVRRSGLGSWGAVLPKKLSSSIAVRPVWASLLPTSPIL